MLSAHQVMVGKSQHIHVYVQSVLSARIYGAVDISAVKLLGDGLQIGITRWMHQSDVTQVTIITDLIRFI